MRLAEGRHLGGGLQVRSDEVCACEFGRLEVNGIFLLHCYEPFFMAEAVRVLNKAAVTSVICGAPWKCEVSLANNSGTAFCTARNG